MSQANYYSDNYSLFDIYNKNQYQTLVKESCNKDSSIERTFKENVSYIPFIEKEDHIKMIPPTTATTTKRSHPAKYKSHAFSTQLRQKILAHKRQQRFEKLNNLQQEKKMMVMKKKKYTPSIRPATAKVTESRTCHAFSSQLYLKLKKNCLSNKSSLAT
ncbi:hypothetical protein BJ944DRAFT_20098 [Cunninghamella echinulata]|nr:hypothetical protein BJ944DRAFT_20098 [Cunninghamella echinulata]